MISSENDLDQEERRTPNGIRTRAATLKGWMTAEIWEYKISDQVLFLGRSMLSYQWHGRSAGVGIRAELETNGKSVHNVGTTALNVTNRRWSQ